MTEEGAAAAPETPEGAPAGASSTGLAPNVAAGLAYLCGWVTGLIFVLIEKENEEVKFHAWQSLFLFGGLTVVFIVLQIVGIIGAAIADFIAMLVGALFALLGLAWFVLWIVCLIQAFTGKHFKVPMVGDYAEQFAAK